MSIRLESNQTTQEKRKAVFNELQEQIKNIKEIQEKEQVFKEDDKQNILREDNENYREPLSIEKEEIIKILLSWGGGEDGFKLTFKDDELLRGVYYCADWGEYEEVELNEDELSLIYDFYLYGEKP